MDNSGSDHYVEELYFLITKFLETGPCKKSLQVLKEEIAQHKIIPKRLDWEGNEHDQSFEELESKYPHIAPQHLLEVCKRIGPILDKEILPCAPGVRTLLGAGSQSLLRNKDAVKKHLRLSEFIVRRHGRSLYSPITCHNHNIVQVLFGQEISGPAPRRHIFSPRLYFRTRLLCRTLGHLTAVYCLLFDQTGKFVITGADDLLVKIWSAVDGRLLCTLRGASAEITDIAINVENTLLAAGSLDKAIRVWCLQTAFPVATLSAHTGMITGVSFCPNPFNGNHYLVSTSTDGSVAFWSYTTDPVIFQQKPTLYNEKIRPGQAQMICSGFSYGGAFLATGSADHHVRVYTMSANPPHRILEMEKHSDRVDSLLWANKGLKFISGSKDGTAIIWQYRAQTWYTKVLDMTTTLPCPGQKEDESKVKLKVTMVCWSCDDALAITAVNNFVIKIWTSSGKLLRELTSHRDVVYVLEYHPLDPSILLSAGHDGIIFLWDLRSGEQLFTHQNYIEGQGNGAIFDAKWSPDGTMMAATDSHGHLLIFGIAEYNNKMESLPKELFFHTDYRPLVRDSQNRVLDEQTQTPPHLMPPPFLVDIDGNPYPPHLQRLVPGREHCTVDQLIPNIIYTPGGQPEVVQFLSEPRSNIDLRIEELAQQANDSTSRNETSSLPRLVRRGEIEGFRQSRGSQEYDSFSWKKRTLVTPLSSGTLKTLRSRINFFGNLEFEEYETERKRDVEYIIDVPTTSSKKPRRKLLHNYRTRATRNSGGPQNEREEGSEGAGLTEGNSSDMTGLSEEMASSDSSDESSSSEYSDWVAEHSVNLEPPQRSRRQRKRKPPASTAPSSTPQPTPTKQQASTSNSSLGTSKKPPVPPPEDIKEIPELYRPSEWLSEVVPKKFPYYPQMGDEVVFFAQGYMLYLKAVTDRKVYELSKSQLRPWGSLELQEPELVKVIGIKYELRPPRLCCLRLAVMKENGSLTGERFTIKYHDVPDVIDFFVLKQTYDTAMMRNWKIGDRFRSMIDDGWWWGVIEGRRPHADSAFLCHRIRWDNGETEDMSPWDMEPIDPSREPDKGGSVPVLPLEFATILYHPRADEWPGGDRESYCERTISGLEEVMGLSIAEPFTAPVDINVYKSYAFVVEFPIDLSTIKARLENRFYRRLTAAQFDIRYLATNAEKFNEPHSVIVKNARIVTDLCLKICKGDEFVDVPMLYRQLVETYESSNSDDEGAGPSTRERAAANRSLRAMRRANHLQPDWRRDCRQLLEVLWSCQDSEPFRGPVDRIEHPDYHKIVATPMDLGQIREELKGNNYSTPVEFCKDIRLIFSNSRQYNTNKRSKIYVMTVRLAALAEEHMKRIIKDWKNATRKQNKPDLNGVRKTRTRRASPLNDSGGSIDAESSGSSSDERPPQPSQSPVQAMNRPKRVKVLLPKVEENPVSSSSHYNNQNTVRPLRLRVPIMKKLNHFVSTSETDSSSQPSSSSSSGHRSLRATKVVSYVENAGDDGSSQSSNDGEQSRKTQPYNMRSSSSSRRSFPISSRVNYNENSSSEIEDIIPVSHKVKSSDSEIEKSVGGNSNSASRSTSESETNDDDLEPVQEEVQGNEGLVVHLNGVETQQSTSNSSSSRQNKRKVKKKDNTSSSESEENQDDQTDENSSNSYEKKYSWQSVESKFDEDSSRSSRGRLQKRLSWHIKVDEYEEEEKSRTSQRLRLQKKPSWQANEESEGEEDTAEIKSQNCRQTRVKVKRKPSFQGSEESIEDERADENISHNFRSTGVQKKSPWQEDDSEEEENALEKLEVAGDDTSQTSRPIRVKKKPSWQGVESEDEEDEIPQNSYERRLRKKPSWHGGTSVKETRPRRQTAQKKPSWLEVDDSEFEESPHTTRNRRTQKRPAWLNDENTSEVAWHERRETVRSRPDSESNINIQNNQANNGGSDIFFNQSGSFEATKKQRSRKRKKSSDSESSLPYPRESLRRSGRARRPLKRQNYTYESDSETDRLDVRGDNFESGSENSTDEKPKISISSRGRVRKITPRARAYLLD